MTGTSREKISAIRKITVKLDSKDFRVDHRYWQALSLSPDLASLRIVDDIVCGLFSGEEAHSACQTITRLRGLTGLEIIVVDEEGRARTAHLAWEKHEARELKAGWSEAVTRPKILAML